MKKTIFSLIAIIFILSPFFVFAQEVTNVEENEEVSSPEVIYLEPIITSVDSVRMGKKIIFDASESTLLEFEGEDDQVYPAKYTWDFGDGQTEKGIEVVHEYEETGIYTVKLSIDQDNENAFVEKQLLVFDRRALILIDENKAEAISLITEQAAEQGVALQVLSTKPDEGVFLTEDNLTKAISEEAETIRDSDVILFYTDTSLGLQAFTKYWRGLEEEKKVLLQKKFFVAITDGSIDIASNFSFQSFKIIQPEFFLLTRKEALNPIFSNKDYNEIVEILSARGIEHQIIDDRLEKSPIFFLSRAINYFASKGISGSTLYLILMIPFIAFIVIFFRQVVGISTFGVYSPVIIAAAFYILGLGFGLLTFLFAVVTSQLMKYLLNKFELLYLPKVALNLSFITISFFIVIWLFLLFDYPISLSIAIFPMLVMSTLAEKFMAAQTETGLKNAVVAVVETLVVVFISYLVIVSTSFSNLILSWPELIILPLIGDVLLAKYSGLRLSEYLRFRSLFAEHTEE